MLEELAKGQADENGVLQGGWLNTYLDLKLAGLHWKKAAFIAWQAAPKATRRPRTMRELATELGYKTEQVFYRWKKEAWFAEIDPDKLRRAKLANFLADVDERTVTAAMVETGAPGVAARKLYYELAGVLNPARLDIANLMIDYSKLTDDELQRIAAGEDPLKVLLSNAGGGGD